MQTPRERFQAAIHRQIPDRIPKFAEFTPHQLATLKAKTGHDLPDTYFDYEMREVFFHPSQAAHDYSAYLGDLTEGATVTEWGVGERPANLYHLTEMIHPMRAFTSVREVEAYPFPDFRAEYRHADLPDRIAALHAQGLAAVSEWTTIFENSWYMRGFEQMMLDFYDTPALAEAILERVTEISIFVACRFAEAGVDLVRTGDDIGTQRGMLISPAMWRKWLKPRLARLIDAVKSTNPAMLVLFDSDGNFDPVIPDLIEIGVDVLCPLQPECNDLARLKREYGQHLAFWGGLGVQSTLPFGTPTDVRREVGERIETLGQGGGYVIATSHVVPPETPWENVVAMFDAIQEFGAYR